MGNGKKNLIVTLADKNFIDQAKQLFSSVYFNSGWAGDYLLLAQGISEEDKNYFRQKGILIYDCPPLSNEPVGIGKYSPSVMAKLYLFKDYFKQWQKIIFLDADIIVQGSLSNLMSLNGFNAAEAMIIKLKNIFSIRNFLTLRGELTNSNRNLYQEISANYDLDAKALNDGVLVFDTDIINKDTYSKAVDLYEKFGAICAYSDETIINLLFCGNWHALPLVYNTSPGFMENLYGLRHGELISPIIHFFASVKPWEVKSPYNKEWNFNLSRFPDIDLTNRLAQASILSKEDIEKYLQYLNRRYSKRIILICLKIYLYQFDRYIGLLGLFIKKQSPKLYKLISFNNDLKKR